MKYYKLIVIFILIIIFSSTTKVIEAKDYHNWSMNFIESAKTSWKIEETVFDDYVYGDWINTNSHKTLSLDNPTEVDISPNNLVGLKTIKSIFKDKTAVLSDHSSSYTLEGNDLSRQIIYRPIYENYKVIQTELIGSGLAKEVTGKKIVSYVKIFSYWEYSYKYVS